ncbi:uncharacterized protein KY384_003803 [Bacidia gigantensis]|uniref:uncharacterized protein n=1 Tax=Bacidia gigantensis TaxID=2732470 RepID=UPI001D048ACA|nr:uncharacterized protein KY384_003803 [Bacidia gigantensis]KAG8532163.1 hypothetical protein KY384_003803 [Bacidia gigantensis]
MPRRKFDKATSTTFQVVHRPQNDPRINDEESSSAVFRELAPQQSHKIKSRTDLESELFSDAISNSSGPSIRSNEGEAAEQGIYYDDTEYDYMQHVYDLDSRSGSVEGLFVEAKAFNKEKKGKGKQSLEEALREANLGDGQSESGSSLAEEFIGEDIGSLGDSRQTSYQDQQNVPDAIAGLQPDMDPRLREVLEALDDEAYVDDEEDLFAEIANGGAEVTQDEFESTNFPDDEGDDGWESDTTEKPFNEQRSLDTVPSASGDTDMSDAPPPNLDHGDGEWMKEFRKFKNDEKPALKGPKPGQSAADLQSSILTSGTGGVQRKKRKGALTSSAGYSMTSSSLARTEGQSLLDARFDKIEGMYADDGMDMDVDDTASTFSKNSLVSGMSSLSKASNSSNLSTTSSQAPTLAGQGLDSMMDEFLGGYKMAGGSRRVGTEKYRTPMQQLDDVRKDLGPARVKAQRAK